MRHLPPSEIIQQNVSAARVFLDDLEEMIDRMRETVPGLEVDPMIGTGIYDSLAELRDRRGTYLPRLTLEGGLRDLERRSRTEFITLRFDGPRIQCTVRYEAANTAAARALVKLCARCSRPLPRWRRPWAWFLWGVLSLVVSLLRQLEGERWQLALVTVSLLCFAIAFVLRVVNRRWYGVHLRRAHEGTWLQRNEETLPGYAIAGAFTIVAAVLAVTLG